LDCVFENTYMILSHIESQLSNINYGWELAGNSYRVKVVEILNCPEAGVNAYITIGLSDYKLQLLNGKTINQELIFVSNYYLDREKISSFLLTLCETMIIKNFGLLRGEVIKTNTPLFNGTELNSLYSTIPIIFKETLWKNNNLSSLVFTWLIPVFNKEADLIERSGWKCFEEFLDDNEVNYFDLQRECFTF
jgi:hypothetical protein